MEVRKATAKVTPGLDEQFITGRLYGKSSSVTLFYFKRNTNCVPNILVKGYYIKLCHFTHLFFFKACISSRPGQSGRCDGYVLEGKELEFYVKKIRAKKSK